MPAPARQRPKLSNPAAASPKPSPFATGLPFDDDEWDAALNPYEPPKEQDKPTPSGYGDDSRRKNRRELCWARRGIKTVNAGLSAVGFSIILSFIMSFFASEEPGGAAKAISTGIVVLYGIGSVALFVGLFLCLGTPEKTGAHGYAKLTCIAQTAQLILGGILVTQGANNPAEIIGLLMFAFLSGVISYFAFVQYMVKMGKYLKRDEVVESATMVMTLGIVEALALVLMVALPLLALQLPDLLWIFGIATIGAWLTAVFGGLIAVFKYIGALEKLSKAF